MDSLHSIRLADSADVQALEKNVPRFRHDLEEVAWAPHYPHMESHHLASAGLTLSSSVVPGL